MSDVFKIEDDGFAQIQIGSAVNRVDVYGTFERLLILDAEVRKKYPDAADTASAMHEYHQRVCGLLDELGFPGASVIAAERFDAHIMKRVDELKKDTAPTQD